MGGAEELKEEKIVDLPDVQLMLILVLCLCVTFGSVFFFFLLNYYTLFHFLSMS